MYLDAILNRDGRVLYNDERKAVRAWLMLNSAGVFLDEARVVRGEDFKIFTVADYINNA